MFAALAGEISVALLIGLFVWYKERKNDPPT
jgi:hypothetical protein